MDTTQSSTMNNAPETVDQFLARGGKITVIPGKTTDEIIRDLKPEFQEIMDEIDKRMGRRKRDS